jgi:hypothetical protein
LRVGHGRAEQRGQADACCSADMHVVSLARRRRIARTTDLKEQLEVTARYAGRHRA